MKKALFVLLTFGLLQNNFVAAQQSNGTYDFLNLNSSARTAALGGGLVPYNLSDIQFAVANPSIVNDSMNGKMSLSYVNYFSGALATAQYAKTYEKIGNFVATLQYFNYGEFTETSESDEVVGTFNPSDVAFTIGWGRALSPQWSIGVNFKLAALQYENYFALGMGVDLATTYAATNGWVYAFTLRNAGAELFNDYGQSNGFFPLKMQVGASKKLEHVPFRFMLVYDNIQRWNMTYDFNDDSNTNLFGEEIKQDGEFELFMKNFFRHFIIGGELYFGKNFIVRGSYNAGRRYEMMMDNARGLVGFSMGAGVQIKRIQINYACGIQHIGGAAHFISLSSNINNFIK